VYVELHYQRKGQVLKYRWSVFEKRLHSAIRCLAVCSIFSGQLQSDLDFKLSPCSICCMFSPG
jgi:hypothetical protein